MKLKKLGFMNIKREDILSRNEMKGVLAGSGGSGGNNCSCSAIPCGYPSNTGCCCNDGRKTCVSNHTSGWLECVSFCEQTGSSGCIAY